LLVLAKVGVIMNNAVTGEQRGSATQTLQVARVESQSGETNHGQSMAYWPLALISSSFLVASVVSQGKVPLPVTIVLFIVGLLFLFVFPFFVNYCLRQHVRGGYRPAGQMNQESLSLRALRPMEGTGHVLGDS